MTDKTQQLAEKQQKLMNGLKSLEPMVNTAGTLLNNLKVTDNMGKMLANIG